MKLTNAREPALALLALASCVTACGDAADPDAPHADRAGQASAPLLAVSGGDPAMPAATTVSPMQPRLIAPLSTSTVSSQRPRLSWRSSGDTTDARVQICLDRACERVEQAFDVTGSSSARVPIALAPGVHYWRVFGRAGAVLSTPSRTWQFAVGRRSAAVDTSGGTRADFDGDGLDDLVVGSPNLRPPCTSNACWTGIPTSTDQGEVLVYGGTRGGFSPTVSFGFSDGTYAFGTVAASAGDVDGDGFADLLVVRGEDPTRGSRAYVYLGGPSGPKTTAVTLTPPTGSLGFSTGTAAGDFNGDGYGDIAIGAPDDAVAGESATGRIFVYFGRAGGVGPVPLVLSEAGTRGFGRALASGDVDGDGFADLAAGAPDGVDELTGLAGAGAACVYRGNAAGVQIGGCTYDEPGTPTSLGSAVAIGDFDGDGRGDLAIAAPSSGWVHTAPAVHVRYASGVTVEIAAEARALGAAGDLNGDGFAELVESGTNVFFGTSTGLTPIPPMTLVNAFGRPYSGFAASAGDNDGDGFGDLVLGDPYYAAAGSVSYSPRVTLVHGTRSITTPGAAQTVIGLNTLAFGASGGM